MTVGQRIAQKRKELGLSQEGLGERLGVSRQAIYKWESDAALPEVEKLVKLGREFGVSVGWLLGEEDEPPGRPELTPEQLRMVEEIVGRYLAAQPAPPPPPLPDKLPVEAPDTPKPPKRRRWPIVTGVLVAAAVLVAVFSNLFSRLDSLNQENQNLQMAVANVRSDVNSEIYTITQRVEEVLQSQNSLTAEQSATVADTDYRANTVTIEARVVPRTYVEGMEAEFLLVGGGEAVTVPGELGDNHAFTARLTAPLTDDITVSAAFLTGGQRQTQVLERFTDLYTGSFPDVTISGGVSHAVRTDGAEGWTASFAPVDVYYNDYVKGGSVQITSLRLGLFRDQELVQWFSEQVGSSHEYHSCVFGLEQEAVLLEPGHAYCVAAVVGDEYGREWVAPDQHILMVTEKNRIEHDYADYSRDPADWDY